MKMKEFQWRIQDFPEGGREPSRGGVNTPNFPENCMKSKEFGRPGGGGACVPQAPLDPPMNLDPPVGAHLLDLPLVDPGGDAGAHTPLV